MFKRYPELSTVVTGALFAAFASGMFTRSLEGVACAMLPTIVILGIAAKPMRKLAETGRPFLLLLLTAFLLIPIYAAFGALFTLASGSGGVVDGLVVGFVFLIASSFVALPLAAIGVFVLYVSLKPGVKVEAAG